ncbi:MAG: amidohydrolase [Clostridia bacterium]|nr:amidohydrolase [Clostridia bacterium]
MFDVLIKNATIITMQGIEHVLYNAWCGIEGKYITYLSENAPENTEAVRTINADGDILMPGLINCHAHTAMTVLRGFSDDCTLNDWLYNHIFPAEAKLDERAVSAGFSLGMAEMLSTGTVTFCDMYYYIDKLAHLADRAGMRCFISNGILSFDDDYEFEKDRAVIELKKLLQDDTLSDRVHVQASIHCERTSPTTAWDSAVSLAKEKGLAMHVHLSETAPDHDGCVKEYGITPAKRLSDHGVFDIPCVAAHCVHVTEDDMKLLAQKHVTAVHNPVSNLKLASGIADICKMRDLGVNVALGTDGASSNNTLDMFEDMKLAALLAKNKNGDPAAFTAYDALCLSTVNGAKALGLSDITGKIQCGYEADLILLDTNKLHRVPMHDPMSCVVYCLGGQDVYMTMVAGKILYENGVFHTLNPYDAVREVKEYVMPLISEK